MQVFPTAAVRNVALAGHGHSGKTSLTSALLFTCGATPRMLKVDEGNTITDHDEEEIARKLTISTGLAACVHRKTKLNLIDTPGYNIFLNDTRAALAAADSLGIVIDGVSGIGVSTHKVWKFADELRLPVFFVVNKLDRERASFQSVVHALHESFGRSAVPVQLPVGEEKSFSDIADLVRMSNIPESMSEGAKIAHEVLVETVAEGEDELMEEFFATGTIGVEHIIKGLQEEMLARSVFPILCASAATGAGMNALADFMAEILPPPSAQPGAPSVLAFKTSADPAAGRVTYFQVKSGHVKDDAHLINVRSKANERFAHLSVPFGKTLQAVTDLNAGDIGVVTKLKDTLTGDTLAESADFAAYEAFKPAESSIAYAISARSHSDENRLSVALTKLLEEDPSLHFYRDPVTHEFLLAGNGQQHLEIVVSRLKRRYGVEVELKSPKIPYRETVRGAANAQGRHKKQSGGHGQFGDCHIKIESLPRGNGFEFVNQIFGGSIPKQFIPAVEKGIVEAASGGYLSGHPVVDFKVTLYDGSYHDVDSSEMAFKLAGRKAFRAAMEQARPVLLEPIMRVDVETPVEFAGDLMSDFSSRRGRINGTDLNGNSAQVIHAQVPMSEMLSYGEDLTSRTQGRGSFHMEFDHYDYVPQAQAEKIISAAKQHARAEDED